jgi:hypothetical protein
VFHEHELYLLDRWSDVRLLEASLKSIRTKYETLFQQAIDIIQDEHKQLDVVSNRVSKSGQVGIGSSAWPLRYGPSWPAGFWIESVALENLMSEKEEQPCASVWLQPPGGMSLEQGASKLYKAAQKTMSAAELHRVTKGTGRSSAFIWYNLPEARQTLFQMLLKGRTDQFVQCMADHFEHLTRLTPVIDEIYRIGKTSRRRKP